jgi:hypothetical protein
MTADIEAKTKTAQIQGLGLQEQEEGGGGYEVHPWHYPSQAYRWWQECRRWS